MNNNFSDMDRVNRIWRHPVYQEHYKKIQELESERIFCRHTPMWSIYRQLKENRQILS